MVNYKNVKISEDARIAKQSVIIGDVTIGRDSCVLYYTVIRGDEAPIVIGEETNIQENCVFPHGQVRDEVVHLEDVAQMAAAVEGQGLLVHIGHTLAVDENVAGVGAVDAAQDVEQRGLAGAGRPQQHAEFAFFHDQVDAFQHLDPVFTAAKGLFDLIQFKKHRKAPLLVSLL